MTTTPLPEPDRKLCMVKGNIAPGAMCGSMIVGDKSCGNRTSPCQHKVPQYTADQMHAHAAAVTAAKDAEIERLNAKAESFEVAFLQMRKALGLGLHSHDNLVEVAERMRAALAEREADMAAMTEKLTTERKYSEGLRTVAQQALEALESGDGWRQSDAITALTTALESK